VLRSSDGTQYRVHSSVLSTASGYFRAVLKGEVAEQRDRDVIQLEAPDKVLEPLLRVVCCLPLQRWNSLRTVDAVLLYAEKYDMPGALTAMRTVMTSPLALEQAVWAYTVASHFGWEEEAKEASRHTLKLSIDDESYDSVLDRMSSQALRKLQRLHQRRVDAVKELLDTGHPFSDWSNGVNCAQMMAGRPPPKHREWVIDSDDDGYPLSSSFATMSMQPPSSPVRDRRHGENPDPRSRAAPGRQSSQSASTLPPPSFRPPQPLRPWHDMKAAIVREITRRPLGDTLFDSEMQRSPVAIACWDTPCNVCGEKHWDRLIAWESIDACLNSLPITV
jgi:hypothetical protein